MSSPRRQDRARGAAQRGQFLHADHGLDQQLHLFDRGKLKSIVYEQGSLMPTDYDKRLSRDEFNNLLAYLTRLGTPPAPAAPFVRMPGGRDQTDALFCSSSWPRCLRRRRPLPPNTSCMSAPIRGHVQGHLCLDLRQQGRKSQIAGADGETPQPAHLWIAPNGKTLYTVNWEMRAASAPITSMRTPAR